MAIRFGGNANGYRINRASFDTKTFDCGTDYRLFINRIDKVCQESKQRNDAICAMKENSETLKSFTGGDCIQRVNITATEVPYNPIMEAANPCIDITSIVETDSLLVSSDGTCEPGIKAFEINIAFNGYGDGTAFLQDPSTAAATIGAFEGMDDQIIRIMNSITFWIIQDYGYDAPIDDFHTFNVTLRGVIKASSDPLNEDYRLDIGNCSGDSKFYQTRYTCSMDLVNGVMREDREITYQGEYASSTEAASAFAVECSS